MSGKLNQEEILRYSRHLMIPEVGLEGQQKLKGASVLIVGTGGLGSPIALYLAAAGVGKLGLVDYDVVDTSNLQRQILHGTSQVNVPKVESGKIRLQDLNPLIEIETYNVYLSAENIESIAEPYEIIVDGTDNFTSRYLLNDYCVMHKKPYVYGSIYRFEGQVSVFDAEKGPCYRCIFPTPPPPEVAPACGEGGVFGVLPGTIGTFQASEVIKLILNIGESAVGKLYLYDALDLSLQAIQLRKNPQCAVCGEKPEITTLKDTEVFCMLHEAQEKPVPDEWQYSAQKLKKALQQPGTVRIIDVRDPVEREIITIYDSENIPVEKINTQFQNVDKSKDVVFICRNGIRSMRIVRKLRENGYENVFNLKGGTNAWVKEIEPEKFLY